MASGQSLRRVDTNSVNHSFRQITANTHLNSEPWVDTEPEDGSLSEGMEGDLDQSSDESSESGNTEESSSEEESDKDSGESKNDLRLKKRWPPTEPSEDNDHILIGVPKKQRHMDFRSS
uniref:Uncharacterized protein n=1 Tax=Moniliophthora roreri TaxID=221103 RepID=A0A0W0GEQ9_MONRR